ncbi:hypothetical protein EBQ93_01250, partial [bacterium]|nr:hypothetical protein [bacterium]
MKNISCDYNTLGGTTAAAYTFGILLDNPSDLTIDSVSCSHNVGNAHVSGLFVNGGSSVSVSNGQFSSNTQQGTYSGVIGVTPLVYATVDTRVVTITPNGNISKHSVLPDTGVDALGWVSDANSLFDAPESLKGAFGIFAKDVDGVSIDTVLACNNTGFRAIGVELLGCAGVQMTDCVTSGQSATGALFLNDAKEDLAVGIADTPGASVIPGSAVTFPARYLSASVAVTPDIFGITYDPVLNHINLQTATVSVLNNAKSLKDLYPTKTFDELYAYYDDFVPAEMLVRAAVAKKRAWGVAVGTQIQNCAGVQIDNLVASSNSSEQDSAIGLLFANHCTDCSVSGGQFTSNQAWTDSQLTITPGNSTGTIDITAMAPFWAALDIDLPDHDALGYITIIDPNYGILSTTDVTAGRFLVRLRDNLTTKELCTPCGPVAAGIIIGDTSERVSVSDVVCAGNNGNAGQAYGLLHDVSTSAVVQNSQFYQNVTNTCGIAFGLAEFTPQSGSIHFGNTAFGNQYENFVNSNYMVPFAPSTYDFPVKIGYNGDIANLANASVYDNIEVRFPYNLPANPTRLPDGVASAWNTLDFTNAAAYTSPGGALTGETLTAYSNTQTGATTILTFDELEFEDAVEGWTLRVQMHEKTGISLSAATTVGVTGSATLTREGFESITGYSVQGFINITVSNLGVVTAVSIVNNAQASNEPVFKVTSPDLQTVLYIQPAFELGNVTNITRRTINALSLSSAITNSSNDVSTVPLDSLNGLTLNTNLGGNGIAVTVAGLNFGTEAFPWNDSSTESTAVRASGSTINGIGIKLGGTVDLAVDTIGRVTVNNISNAFTVTDASDRVVATLDISGASLTASYSGYNHASRTANMTFTCNNPPGQTYTTISNPVLGSLNSDILVGYSLTNVSLTCSGGNNVAPGSNNVPFTVSGTGRLIDGHGHTIDVNITGQVHVDTTAIGVPTKGTTASTLSVKTATTEITLGNIMLGSFTFNCDTVRNVTLALDTAITNSGTNQSTIVLEPTDGIATMSPVSGVDIVTTALSFAASNVFNWNSTTNRSISGTATMIGAGDTTITGSGSVVINQYGDVTSFTGTLTATVGGALVATLNVTGLSNESYSGYNEALRTATI